MVNRIRFSKFRANLERSINLPSKETITNSKSGYQSGAGQIRKRHWALGTLVILCGSWITHTTTATIAPPNPEQFSEEAIETVDSGSVESIRVSSKPALKEDADTIQVIDSSQTSSLPAVSEPLVSRPHLIKRGESLGFIFKKQGISPTLAHNIANDAVAKKLTSIRVGKALDLRYSPNNELQQIVYPITPLQELVVDVSGTDVANAEIKELDYQIIEKAVSAEIDSSLYLAAQEAGLSNNLIMEMVRIFGWDIDFVQDIRTGDQFHILFTENVANDEYLSDGHIIAAEFTTQGETFRAFRFEDQEGNASYYNEAGDSMLGTFLRSPVEFSRISSRFGRRLHPISKKWKAHNGVDYAASTGTPIRATADGKVVSAGRKGGYGKTVVIRHAGRFSTLYAHMNGYAKGIRSGAKVKQGQTIGYVGSTGMSTGPHLHYEFRVDGVHRNPLSYKTPKASSVSEQNTERYQQLTSQLLTKIEFAKKEYLVALSRHSSRKL